MVGSDKTRADFPFVLFGTNTKKTHMDTMVADGKSENTTILSTGVAGDPAQFMVC